MNPQTPRQITFEDIREGDYIEVTWRVNDLECAHRGVADYISTHGAWCTESGRPIVAEGEGGTITLLHRPTAVEPEGLGAVVRVGSRPEYVSTNREPGEPRWVYSRGRPREQEGFAVLFRWDEFDPDSIEVLSEGIEVDQ